LSICAITAFIDIAVTVVVISIASFCLWSELLLTCSPDAFFVALSNPKLTGAETFVFAFDERASEEMGVAFSFFTLSAGDGCAIWEVFVDVSVTIIVFLIAFFFVSRENSTDASAPFMGFWIARFEPNAANSLV
tara:strand:+ start:1378 stop:1779 length:402 start_codon:yes stop_codon:yes gene_type:complete